MDRGMDTGHILLSEEIPIGDEDTAGTLHDKLMERGAGLVVNTLKAMMEGTIRPMPQDHSQATYTKPTSKAEGRIDWHDDAQYIAKLVRAMNPWPGAFFSLSDEKIRVWKARAEPGSAVRGRIESLRNDGIRVGTGNGILLLQEIQAPSRNPVAAIEFARKGPTQPSSLHEQGNVNPGC
jgi:methionyl-tRNA formyltransferase